MTRGELSLRGLRVERKPNAITPRQSLTVYIRLLLYARNDNTSDILLTCNSQKVSTKNQLLTG